MTKRLSMHDPWLFGLAMLATLLGIFFIFDAGYARSLAGDKGLLPREFIVQMMLLPIALGCAVFVARQPSERWRRWSKVLWFVSLVTLFLPMAPVIGVEQNGSERWIRLAPGVLLQPAEFAKVAVVLYLAGVFAGRAAWPSKIKRAKSTPDLLDRIWIPKIRRFMPAVWVLLAVVVIEQEPDLGTAAVLAVSAGLMFYIGGVSKKSMLWMGALSAVVVFALVYQQPYRLERITNHAHRWDPANVDDTGYQTVQSELGMASGGWTGVGIGAGRSKHVLPAATTDFVTATVGEEFGLVGSLFLLGVIGALVARLLLLAQEAKDAFARLVLVGVAGWVGSQAFVNIMMANGLMPAIGIPLPFVSSGGSSLIALWMAIGLCQSVLAPVPVKEEERAASGDGWRNRRTRLSRA